MQSEWNVAGKTCPPYISSEHGRRNKTLARVALLVLCSVLAAGCNQAHGPDVMATVNGKPIMRPEVETLYKINLGEAQQQATSKEQADIVRMQIIQELIDQEIVQQRAASDNFATRTDNTGFAAADFSGRMADIADMVHRSRATAQDVAAVAAAMQSVSQTLCEEIPDIVRKAIKADLREFPRYEVSLPARLEVGDRTVDVTVHDISQGGARIGAAQKLGIGDQVALTFSGMNSIAGQIVRHGDNYLGVCFNPARLRPEELRDLVTKRSQAA